MKCERCGGPSKPLFTSNYCVNECDRPKTAAESPRTGDYYKVAHHWTHPATLKASMAPRIAATAIDTLKVGDKCPFGCGCPVSEIHLDKQKAFCGIAGMNHGWWWA